MQKLQHKRCDLSFAVQVKKNIYDYNQTKFSCQCCCGVVRNDCNMDWVLVWMQGVVGETKSKKYTSVFFFWDSCCFTSSGKTVRLWRRSRTTSKQKRKISFILVWRISMACSQRVRQSHGLRCLQIHREIWSVQKRSKNWQKLSINQHQNSKDHVNGTRDMKLTLG